MEDKELSESPKKPKKPKKPVVLPASAEYFRILRPPETAKLVGLSTVHVHRLEKAGKFPKRFKLNADSGEYGAAGHYLGEVLDYLKARAAERDASDEPEAA